MLTLCSFDLLAALGLGQWLEHGGCLGNGGVDEWFAGLAPLEQGGGDAGLCCGSFSGKACLARTAVTFLCYIWIFKLK